MKMMLLNLRQPSWILAARSKTTRDTAWQTTKMDLAQKHLRKAYLPTLTPKCLGLSKYLKTGLVYKLVIYVIYKQVLISRKWYTIEIYFLWNSNRKS